MKTFFKMYIFWNVQDLVELEGWCYV